MGFLGVFGDVLGVGSSLMGMLGGIGESRRARQVQDQILREMERTNDAGDLRLLGENLRGMYEGFGGVGDQTLSFGKQLGDALAGSGVWNSTGVSSAIQQNQAAGAGAVMGNYRQAELARMGARDTNKRAVLGQRLQNAYGTEQRGMGQASGGAGNLQSLLQSMSQRNLAQSGANAVRLGQNQTNGTINQAQNLPGNYGVYGDFMPAQTDYLKFFR